MTVLLFRWLPVGVWMALIFVGSSMPQLPVVAPPLWQELLADLGHFGEYAILAGLLWRAFRPTAKWSAFWVCCFVFVIASLYAVTDEFHQSFVPGREASLGDLAVDMAGAAVALVVLFLWPRKGAAR